VKNKKFAYGFKMRTFDIQPVDRTMQAAIQEKIDNLNKPKGSLGRLEELAMQICLIQQTLKPSLAHPCHLLLGADHGIEREGVSVSPRCVTWQQMLNFARGGGGVNMFCRQHGFKLRIVDVGVDYDFTKENGERRIENGELRMENGELRIENGELRIENYKIAHGTRNFLYGPAMTEEEFSRSLAVGIGLVDACHAEGCHVLSIGEMGIGNTSPSSIWMHLFGHIPLEECIGAGAGLDTPGIRHKYEVLSKALENYKASIPSALSSLSPTLYPIRYFGGFEMVAAIGAMLRAAEQHLIILIDGFIMTACAIAAIRLYPASQDYMIFTHCGDESGHKKMLDIVGAKPLLNLGLRLGEGTGALCAFPIVQSAVNMINEMNNFQNAHITKYF
jgi:nicotinate-nucleotide--dimethylbenzimidazole phosphoribosyltransferase